MGLALLGIDRVQHYARRTCEIHCLSVEECLSADTEAEYARMWPSFKACQLSHDAAYRVTLGFHARLSAPLSRSGQ